nr:hypothetical protein [Tanacetum cinerariifolium]
MGEIDIETLTMDQNKDDDAYEHVEKVLDITRLFNIPRISKDAIMLRVFPIIINGVAKKWMERVPAGSVKTWELVKSVEQENVKKISESSKTPKSKPVIDYTKSLQELVSKKTKIKEVSMVKLNARCSIVLQNELPPKEKDPWSFILPCIIRLGNPKRVRTLIDMADKSMQSPKGIIENVLVKIDKFIFPVDSVILDIVEDDKVLIILGRPMLANVHARNWTRGF